MEPGMVLKPAISLPESGYLLTFVCRRQIFLTVLLLVARVVLLKRRFWA